MFCLNLTDLGKSVGVFLFRKLNFGKLASDNCLKLTLIFTVVFSSK